MSTTEDRVSEETIYELAYLILPSIPEDSLPKTVSSLKEIISKGRGREIASEDPFKHPLTYSMSKVVGSSKYVVDEAYIGWIKFDLPLDREEDVHPIEGIKSQVEKLDEVLRFLLVKAPRDTTFTFAKAREAAIARDLPAEEVKAPVVDEVEESLKNDDVIE